MKLNKVHCPSCNSTEHISNIEDVHAYRPVLGRVDGALVIDMRELPEFGDGDSSKMTCSKCDATWDFSECVYYIECQEDLDFLELDEPEDKAKKIEEAEGSNTRECK